jgi:hypothetical protein
MPTSPQLRSIPTYQATGSEARIFGAIRAAENQPAERLSAQCRKLATRRQG